MGSDYDRWKKKRDAERAQRDRDETPRPHGQASGGGGVAPPPGGYGAYGEPRRSYQGPVPPPGAPRRRPPARRRGGGCTGCLGLLLGLALLIMVGGLILGAIYWRQIEQRGRVNVLLLGIDERPDEGSAFRSDTMILSTFNPRQREVVLLAIPRDLWVTVPDVGENRINTAHFFGGPALAKETVALPANFDLPVNYYVRLNFDGFTRIIDAMGGIEVEVPEPLRDENYPTPDYGVTTVEIPAGRQTMDGATALIYARSRYSTSDFDRSRRQQEILDAVRAKLLRPGTILRLPAIYRALGESVQTDIPTNEWPALALILARSRLERVAIGVNEVIPTVTDSGAEVLLPNWEAINPILDRYFVP